MTLSHCLLREIRDYNDRYRDGVGMFVDLRCPTTGVLLTALGFCNYLILEGHDDRYRWAVITDRGRAAIARIDRLGKVLEGTPNNEPQ